MNKNKQDYSISDFEQLELPENFGAEIFELELQVEETDKISIETITKLLGLYAIGIQYYESIQNNRYLIFKNRTQKLLLRGNVNNAMQKDQIIKEEVKRREQINEQMEKENTMPSEVIEDLEKQRLQEFQDKIKRIDQEQKIQQKKTEVQLSLEYIRNQDRKNYIDQMIEKANQNYKNKSQILENNIQQQETLLKDRIQQKKQKKMQQKLDEKIKTNNQNNEQLKDISENFENQQNQVQQQ